MKIRFEQPFKLVKLRDLKPGDMFRDENNQGLFLKTISGTTVIQKLDTNTAVSPGCEAGFSDHAMVIRIKQIIVFPEVV